MKTVRDMINDYRTEILNTDLSPVRASEVLTELSALVGNIADELKDDAHKSASRAKAVSLTTPEYESLLEAKGTREVLMELMLMELIRSLKYYLRTKLEESREAYGKQY